VVTNYLCQNKEQELNFDFELEVDIVWYIYWYIN